MSFAGALLHILLVRARVLQEALRQRAVRLSHAYWLTLGVVALLAIGIRLWFWLHVNWVIEDAMISARMIRNLAQYGQLTFNLGTRVSSSTSPVFVLLAAIFTSLGFEPLTSARLLGLLASAMTCVLTYDLLCSLFRPQLAGAVSAFYVFLPPVVAYSVGGMETALYTLACFVALERLIRQKSLAAMIWACMAVALRADGVLVMLVVLGVLAWECRRHLSSMWGFAWPLSLVLLVYLAHALYFGSVLPQSIVAKLSGYAVDPLQNTLKYLERMFLAQPTGLPVYALAVVGAAWAWRRWRRGLLLLGWYVLYHLSFMLRAPLFDWYLQPPLVVLCLFASVGLGEGLSWGARRFKGRVWSTNVLRALVTILGIALLGANGFYARGRQEAQVYENLVRASAGHWLAENTLPGTLVFTESLGYIGYFAGQNAFVDWPGLASRGVPELLELRGVRTRQDAYDVIIETYHPAYLALRDSEWVTADQSIRNKFRICREFLSPNDYGPSYILAGQQCP